MEIAILISDFYNASLDFLAGKTNLKNTKLSFSDDELNLISSWQKLNERNKGKLKFFIEQLLTNQEKI